MRRNQESTLRGMMLVVGPDGAGKTTVLDELQRQLDQPLQRAHSRPGVIAGRASDGAPVTDPHAQTPRGTVPSLIKLLVVFADTVLGTWLRWKPLARQHLLVVERGWYDLAVDPHRYRLPTSFRVLVTRLGRLVPRADVVVVLSGDPAEFHRRKPEIGTAEVARQLAAWDTLARSAGRRVVRLDTVVQTPAASAAALVKVLAEPERRWLRVPAAPGRLEFRATGAGPALQIYRPHRRTARLAAAGNTPLLRFALARRARPPAVPHLEELLARGPRATTQLAAFRSSGAGRWIIGAADCDGLHTVMKAGPADDAGLGREIAALQTLSSATDVILPQLRWEDRREGWLAFGMGAVPTAGPLPALERIAELTAAMTRGDLGVPVVHGDLAPWNLALVGERVAVWDWEEAQLDRAWPLHDLTHYLVRSGSLLGTATPVEAARLLTDRSGPGARHLRALALAVDMAAELVGAYLARTSASSRAEEVYRDALAAAISRGLQSPTPSAGARS
jgi:hypothetical protein